jgi:acyl-coenzyme A synthetase/AMP-(fatty) acid ligase
MAEADVAGVAATWLAALFEGRLRAEAASDDQPEATGTVPRPVWAAIDERRDDHSVAFVDQATGDSISCSQLAQRVDAVASALYRRGLTPGDHVAMLTPPGVDLVAAVYGVWRAGGVTVIADRGLGVRGLGRAVRSARPRFVIGPRQARSAAAVLRWAPRATRLDIDDLVHADPGPLPAVPGADDPAAVLFTSGATGPAKGVRYLHGQLAAQRDALAAAYSITSADRLVAAFAPFALYGPALGIPTALPDVDVTAPGELTAEALDGACVAIGATLAFASPAALANVTATAPAGSRFDGLARLRVVLSAGAPVPSETLRAMATLAADASLHTPYGMTEVLPVADIDLTEIERAERDDPNGGVCVGHAVAGAEVRIAALGFDPGELPPELAIGATGEILVRAPWVSEGYLGLWATQRAARPGPVGDWHRSGDVGHLDAEGRLWVEGRVVHVIHTADGPITSVPIERQVERSLDLARVAAVGVGPNGRQQLIVVIEDGDAAPGPVDAALAGRVRAVIDAPVASVLSVPKLPVDIRHNAKIDRVEVASWASDLLAGRRARRLSRRR